MVGGGSKEASPPIQVIEKKVSAPSRMHFLHERTTEAFGRRVWHDEQARRSTFSAQLHAMQDSVMSNLLRTRHFSGRLVHPWGRLRARAFSFERSRFGVRIKLIIFLSIENGGASCRGSAPGWLRQTNGASQELSLVLVIRIRASHSL